MEKSQNVRTKNTFTPNINEIFYKSTMMLNVIIEKVFYILSLT